MKSSYVVLIAVLLPMMLNLGGLRPIQAQEFRATLTGQVTDPSGAVVVSASVSAVENDTHITYTGTTSATGVYYIPYVLPGTYT